MQINSDKSVQFEIGDFVCVIDKGVERCGEIVKFDDTLVQLDDNDGIQFWVEEKACYPG